jgi:hypothetical protein
MLSLALPSGLQQLQSLSLRSVELPAAADSYAQPQLTHLRLLDCAVRPCSDTLACVARQLLHLTGLQCVELHWLHDSWQNADPLEAGIVAFEDALGQLQRSHALA